MKYEIFLQYEEERMNADLQKELNVVMEQIVMSMIDFMKAYCGDPDILNSFRYEKEKDNPNDKWEQISYLVGSDDWNAFIANYGKGSLMANESQNPFLAEYKSKYFHSYRDKSTNAISARPKTNTGQLMPDFETGDGYVYVNGTGTIPAGTNLEGAYAWKTYKVRIRPKRPSFFMENTFSFFETEMARRIQEVLDRFPFDKYLKGAGDR